MIPKKIHYCWFGRNPKPKLAEKCIASWKKYCPDYEIIEWNEDNFDINMNVYTRYCYENKKWAYLSDFARLYVVAENGGVYFDTDVELLKNPDELLKLEAFYGFETEKCINTGLGFGAEKNHPTVMAMVEEYEKFFAEMLTRAEQVIHISAASGIGPVYETAKLAAKGFDNVHVVDSGQISGGQALVALCAAKYAMQGKRAEEICEEIEKVKGNVRTRFVLTRMDTIQKGGARKYLSSGMLRAFGLHPVLRIKQGKLYVAGLCRGKLENAWKYLVLMLLRKKKRISSKS